MTYEPGRWQTQKIEARFKMQVYPLSLALTFLRADGTYVLGYCNNQIAEIGRYRLSQDSMWLYDRYDLVANGKMNSRTVYFDTTSQTIYYVEPLEERSSTGFSEGILPLRKNEKKSGHYGFLRGEDMSYDSLRNYYVQQPSEYQQRWSDSVRRAQGT